MVRPRLEIVVRIEARAWRAAWPKAANETRRFLTEAMGRGELDVPPGAEVTVVLADDARLQALNGQFRGKDKATNVLSFPDTATPIGGMALAYETVRQEATAQGK